MLLDDRAADRQADADAAGLGGEERVENLITSGSGGEADAGAR